MKSLRQVRAAARYPPVVKQKFQSRLRSNLRLKRLQTAKQPPAQQKTEQAAFYFFITATAHGTCPSKNAYSTFSYPAALKNAL